MVSRAIGQHSGLTQNLINILQDIYPETDSLFLDNFAADIANQALKHQSSKGLGGRELWSANDVLLIAYPDNLNSQTPHLSNVCKNFWENIFLTR